MTTQVGRLWLNPTMAFPVTCRMDKIGYGAGQGQDRVKPLFEADEIREAVEQLGQRIVRDYAGKSLTVLGVLTGSIILLADLVRAVDRPLTMGLIRASSYRGKATRSDSLTISDDVLPELEGRDVLLVDDILDTGRTLEALLARVRRENPASLRSAVLLWKQGRQEVEIEPDFFCFRVPDVFVVGYGLDYDGEYRQLPFLAALEDHDL